MATYVLTRNRTIKGANELALRHGPLILPKGLWERKCPSGSASIAIDEAYIKRIIASALIHHAL